MGMQTFLTLAGIGWDPEIRGLLTVAVAAAVLMGSIWLLLVTNTGVRLGSMIALAGFFGWIFIMTLVWWMYGIGYTGDTPVWEIAEFNSDPALYQEEGIGGALTSTVSELPDPNCTPERIFPEEKTGFVLGPPDERCVPRAIAMVDAYDGSDADAVQADLATVDEDLIRTDVEEVNDALDDDDPRKLSDAELEEEVAAAIAREEANLDQLTLSSLASTHPQVVDWVVENGYLVLGDWNLLSTAEAGEAAASAEAALLENGYFDAPGDFLVLNSYQQGGKDQREGDSTWDRVQHRIESTIQLTHPTNYAVVQVQEALDKEQEPGKPPPLIEWDSQADTVSVVMVRDLGNERMVPALIAFGSGLIFAALAFSLHVRDLRVQRRDDEYEQTIKD
jgi:hypothetical protein